MRSCQAMIGVPSTASPLGALLDGRGGWLCRRHDRGALAGLRLMIGKQDRRQRVAHVVLDVVGQHAQEHVRFHAMSEPVVHGPHLQIDAFQRAEGPLDQRQVLVAATAACEPILSAGRLVRIT